MKGKHLCDGYLFHEVILEYNDQSRSILSPFDNKR